ncbi:MAG: SGNH/GDSL hydrolase family protein [Actinomycetota bacterium]
MALREAGPDIARRRAIRPQSLARRSALVALGASGLVGAQAHFVRRRPYLFEPPEDLLEVLYGDADRALNLTVIGDSTAVGVGAGTRARSYPAQLAGLLAAERIPVRLSVVGRSGARWADVASELAPQAAQLGPDLVVIGIGGNDAIHLTQVRSLRKSVSAALEMLCDAATSVLVILGPRFDSPVCPRPLRDIVESRCRAVNRCIARVAAEFDVPTIDPRPLLGDSFAREPLRYFSEDLLHPGPEGYRLWAEAVAGPVIEAASEVMAEDAR